MPPSLSATAATCPLKVSYNPQNLPTATAGAAPIVAAGGTAPGTSGGFVDFSTWSTAGNATITAQGGTVSGAGGAYITFDYSAHAGDATLIANGGTSGAAGGSIVFRRGATGDNARVVTFAGGVVDVSGNTFYGGTSVGSVEGAGAIYLQGSLLTVGGRNTSTTFSGQIVDGDPGFGIGGLLTKVGSGKLSLSGANAYTGLTTVTGGTLAVDGSIVGAATVNSGGTLQGAGNVGGLVTVNSGGTLSPGNSPGQFSVSSLSLLSGSQLTIELGGAQPGIGYDTLSVSGLASLGGVLAVLPINGFQPALNDAFAVLSFNSRAGDFSTYSGLAVGGHLMLRHAFTTNSLLLTARPTIDGDINLDGTVNIFDINAVSSNWSTAGPQGDANGDGIVNIFDINLISANWGATSADRRARAACARTYAGWTVGRHSSPPESVAASRGSLRRVKPRGRADVVDSVESCLQFDSARV